MADGDLDRLVRWLRESSISAEVVGTEKILVPQLDAGTVGFEPNIPALGATQFIESPSGLLIPARVRTETADLFGSFLVASDYSEESVPLEELTELLRDKPMRSLVGKLAAINCLLEQNGLLNRTLSEQLLAECCPSELAAKMRPLIESGDRVFSSSQVVLTAVKLLLRYGADSEDDYPNPLVGPIVLAVADNIAGRVGADDPGWPLELLRYGFFYAKDTVSASWGRFKRIWLEILPAMTTDTDFVDVRDALARETGVPFDDYVALAVAISAMFNARIANREAFWQPLELQGVSVSAEHVRAFFEYLSEEPDWYVRTMSFDDEALYWDFTAMRAKPLIRFQDRVAPLSLEWLFSRTADGVFYSILDDQRRLSGSAGVEKWTRLFGRVWEAYVRLLIDQVLGGSDRVVPEGRLKDLWPEPGQKICDAVLRYPERWLLLEAVAKRFTIRTVALGGLEDFERDLLLGVIEKARQLGATAARLTSDGDSLDSAAKPNDRITPVLVVPGPFPQLPPVLRRLRELISSDAECAGLRAGNCDPLLILSAGDLELLLGTSVAGGYALIDLLDRWQASDRAMFDFRAWASGALGRTQIPAWLEEAKRELVSFSTEHLFHQRSG